MDDPGDWINNLFALLHGIIIGAIGVGLIVLLITIVSYMFRMVT